MRMNIKDAASAVSLDGWESLDPLAKVLIKKDKARYGGALEYYDQSKVIRACRLAAERTDRPLTDEQMSMTVGLVEKAMIERPDNVITVSVMHSLVEAALREVRPDVAQSYIDYRSLSRKWAKILDRIFRKVSALCFRGDNGAFHVDRDNANHDDTNASTIAILSAGYLGTEMYKLQFLTAKEKQAEEDGYIYPHDKDKRYFYPYNCCQADLRTLLSGGFEMGNLYYNEPKRLSSVFDVLSDVILSAASQQYGGFTIPEVDTLLEPYAEKSYAAYVNKYTKLGIDVKTAEETALADVQDDFEQGFQGWEYKFNTVASSRGDYPFITVTGGLGTSRFAKMAMKTMLKVRRSGQGKPGFKKPVLFPKIVFLFDERLHGEGCINEDVFEEGIECSSATMYPDWLSLTGEGYVASMYKKYGKAISPMGCRAFLSPWYERGGMEPADENDVPVFMGRFNIGAVSLNLPMIYQKSVMDGRDFYETLDYYLEMIRGIHKRTYEFIGNMPASRSPLAFCEGMLYGGHLSPSDKIKPVLASATASFGVTALNELQRLFNGKNLDEDNNFALEVMHHINEKVAAFKKEDGHLYAIYGTPAESLCGKQVEQFRDMFGVVEGVSDREYVTNSFHCHVTRDLNAFEKQDKEKEFWDLFNGGKIQYVKYPVSYNKEAYRSLVRRAMEMGFYEGCNRTLAYCEDCGHVHQDSSGPIDVCEKCGSGNLTKIDRMNGYLSYSRVKGDTRLNAAKMAEIGERVSM